MIQIINFKKGQSMKYTLKSNAPAKEQKNDDFKNEAFKKMVAQCFQEASQRVSPLWDIRDYVAVNPFFGFREQSFLEVARWFQRFSKDSFFPKKDYFLKKFSSGEVTDYDLETAIRLYHKQHGLTGTHTIHFHEAVEFLNTAQESNNEFKVKCLSDLYDLQNQSNTTKKITEETSKWAAAYFDEGQAVWKIPKEDLRFYAWWKSLVQYDTPFGKDSADFVGLVQALPHDPTQAVQMLTQKLQEKISLSPQELSTYFYRLFDSVMGWSAYLQKFEFEAQRTGDSTTLKKIGGLIDMLAIRMAYDVALLNNNLDLDALKNCEAVPSQSFDCGLIWLMATEVAYRRSVETAIKTHTLPSTQVQAPLVQAAFCIDVRSEVLRRHLESVSPQIQTIGFAGFFAMPISLKGLGNQTADQNCPVLLNSKFEICETAGEKEAVLKNKKSRFVQNLYLKKSMQASANSGFSFMETMGLGYIAKMLAASFGKTPNVDVSSLGLSAKDKAHVHLNAAKLSLEQKVSLAQGALKNMGLTKNFAKYVFFFGHGGQSANNPYASALDCGACAGHNGQGNANLLATLLNEERVRQELATKGIDIPTETVFLSGWHHTTKDELVIDPIQALSTSQKQELHDLQKKFDQALENCRQERAQKLPLCKDLKGEDLKSELSQRANDWSEIRPEWGLARNASFIVARRNLTRQLSLDGRSFLHDYDHSNDPDLSILELIMTAPMIVTNWINMQYYASTVDPIKFGAGNKVLNNVVGGIGCIQGNASDFLGGLTEQSVLYKGDYYHEPLRLQVFIEAPTESIDHIIQKHQMVKELIFNNWLTVIAINPQTKEFSLNQSGSWIQTKEELWN